MFWDRSLQRARRTYADYPGQFWTLVAATFIDQLGGALLFPFITLFITAKFAVGMTRVGALFGLVSIGSVLGGTLGGALTDRLGRKGVLIFGLVSSGLTSLAMGLANSFQLLFVLGPVVGLFMNFGGPARQAMVADLLPEGKRAQGFAILRTVNNLAVVIGPAIGGLLALTSYLLLFVCDTVASLITAGIVLAVIRETKPAPTSHESEETMAQTLAGYRIVLRDAAFSLFLGACVLMTLVYMQMNTTLAVYLRDTHGVSQRGFGYVMSLNAAMVVLFQFGVTKWTCRYRPPLVMAFGTLLYAIGFAMYGFVSTYVLFLVAMVVITIGEMVVSPTSTALVASLSPEDMRGRYMAVFGFAWAIAASVGPLMSGLIMDNADPRWLWYATGVMGLIAAGTFALPHLRAALPAQGSDPAAGPDGDANP